MILKIMIVILYRIIRIYTCIYDPNDDIRIYIYPNNNEDMNQSQMARRHKVTNFLGNFATAAFLNKIFGCAAIFG